MRINNMMINRDSDHYLRHSRVSGNLFLVPRFPACRQACLSGRQAGAGMTIMGKWSLSLFIVFLSSVSCLLFPVSAFAAASVSVTAGSTWALGVKGGSSESTSSANAWTVTNDSGGTEDVNIKVTSTGLWTASIDATLTANEFLLRKDSSVGQIITGTDGSLVTGLVNVGTNSFGLYFKAPPTGSEEGAHTLTVTLTATNWVWVCGNGLAITHTAGVVAPVTKSVTYGTVTSSLTGASKCWITRNLGADQQATATTDATEASAGWYWQFNRKQGYKHDGTTRTPASAWITSINETSNWLAANDPCTIELGAGWRLPTSTEWTNADGTPQNWANYNDTYASVLKLHAAGYLGFSSGALDYRGSYGTYWGSTQSSANLGWYLSFGSGDSAMYSANKAYGFSVRCLRD